MNVHARGTARAGRAGRAVLLFCLPACACTSQPLEFADWTIPVPEGTPIIEHTPIPMEAREGLRIGLGEDLVLGLGEDPNKSFYGVSDVGMDDDQNLYVMDSGNHRVQVFDRVGRYLRSLGARGQGPGEFERPYQLVVSGEHLIVSDINRVHFWNLEGKHQRTVTLQGVTLLSSLYYTPDGLLLAAHAIMSRPETPGGFPSWSAAFAAFSTAGEQTNLYAELPLDGIAMPLPDAPKPAPVTWPVPLFAVSSAGTVYVSPGDEYQVLAFAPDGSPRWALRVAWPRQPLSAEQVDAALQAEREQNPEARYADYEWPEAMPALFHLAVDDHGHIYVYPYAASTDGPGDRPVDVYSPDGERLYSGIIAGHLWTRARGDWVFRVGTDPRTEERVVARYRLVEPF